MKNLSKTILVVLATGVLSCGLFCQQAQAVLITGDINFSGNVTYNTRSLGTATQVTTWNSSFVVGTSGDFSTANGGVPNFTAVTMHAPYVFNPSTAYSPMWSLTYNGSADSYSFNLFGSTIVTQNATFLNIKGLGTIFGTGFDPTPGSWSFTSSNANGQDKDNFSFAADTSSVPDGGATAALLGLALTGVEVLRRKFKAA
jgi:hypothetical protein